MKTRQIQHARGLPAETRRGGATRRGPGHRRYGFGRDAARCGIAAVLALLAATACPTVPRTVSEDSIAVSGSWTFPLPAFPEPLPREETYTPSSSAPAGGSAPLPPDLAQTDYPLYPATNSTAASGRWREKIGGGDAAPTAGAVVIPPPTPGLAEAAATRSPAGFAAVDWQAEDTPGTIVGPSPSIRAPGIRGDASFGEAEEGETGVVERHFPSGQASTEFGQGSETRLIVQAPPPGPLRRWLQGRPQPPDSPEFWRSWLEEPFSGGMGVGYLQGTALIDDWVQEGAGLIGTGRLGWDFAPNLGLETRLSFGSVELRDSFAAVAARWAADDAAGLSESDPLRRRFTDRNATAFQWDVSLLYYPTDYHPARFYLLWGAGLTRMDFTDRFGESYEGTYFTMPVGLGIKFRRLTDPIFRLEFTDNIVFPSRFNVTHHLALTAGLEFRWGGPRRRYWPWTPGY